MLFCRWPGGICVGPATCQDDEEPGEPAPKAIAKVKAKAKNKAKTKPKKTPSSQGSRKTEVKNYSTSYTTIAAFPVLWENYWHEFPKFGFVYVCFLCLRKLLGTLWTLKNIISWIIWGLPHLFLAQRTWWWSFPFNFGKPHQQGSDVGVLVFDDWYVPRGAPSSVPSPDDSGLCGYVPLVTRKKIWFMKIRRYIT